MIDYSPLANALRQLNAAIEEQRLEPKRTLLRDGLIQRFEFVFELSLRLLRRHLEETTIHGMEVRQYTFESLIRLADENEILLSPVAMWKKYREARNLTSHTYNEAVALDLVGRIPPFAWEAQHLLERLKKRDSPNA
jgi:nucleotidyltransferase substrate binding protein (TIGR01987 family)